MISVHLSGMSFKISFLLLFSFYHLQTGLGSQASSNSESRVVMVMHVQEVSSSR